MIDIVFPDGNEKEFIKRAELLGIDSLIFVYKSRKDFYKKDKIQNAWLTIPQKIQKDVLCFCRGPDDARLAIERSASLVYDLELEPKKDPTHHRRSGLNQVLCKFAKQKGTVVAFSFSSILNSSGMKRAQLLGRMSQNIRFCRKFGVKMKMASFASDPLEMRSPSDLQSFFEVLGMHAAEAKKALDF